LSRFDIILKQATLPGGGLASIGISDGRIATIEKSKKTQESELELIELDGALVIPGLVEGHCHLDKTFLGDAWRPHRPCSDGFDVAERVTFEKELLAAAAPVEQRAQALVELAISQGTTHMRTHVDIDMQAGLSNLEAVVAVRDKYRDAISIQIVAFPQGGVIKNPGTDELLDEAVQQGADLVGGLDPASFDRDIDGHLDVVFGIAERRGAGIDIHLHDLDALGIFQLEQIALRTKALGMQGRVAVSHAYALGMVQRPVFERMAGQLAESGVAIMTNAPGNVDFPLIIPLREAGVTVFTGNDNIRDSWWPYGDADMLERAMIVGYRSGFYTDDELSIAFDLATYSGAHVLGVKDYGLHVGAVADLVVLEARNIAEAVVARPPRRYVFKAGRIVARDGQFLAN